MDNTLLKLDVDWEKLTREIDLTYFDGKYSHLTPHQFFVAYFSFLMNRIPKWQHREMMKRRLEAELAGIPKVLCFPYKGVMKNLHKKYKIGIVSGNLRKTIITALRRCGMYPYIDSIVGIDDVPVSKPSPIPLRMTLKKLRCKPSDSIYVGDHPDDVRAGIAAGMKTVIVKHSQHFQEYKEADVKADIVIKSLFELENAIKKIETRELEVEKKEQRKLMRAREREMRVAQKKIEKVSKETARSSEWKKITPTLQLSLQHILDKISSVFRKKR
jgi:HAD superfamily hydrolase (TIGR01509 family)